MKIIHSFWSKPFLAKGPSFVWDRKWGGWNDKMYHYLSWTFSCLQFKKYYEEVELITDSYGKYVLVDLLGLPYTKVSVVLDRLNRWDKGLWALGKLYSYEMQKEPFLHVDSDVFIWKRFERELEQAPLVAQNLESNFFYYQPIVEEIRSKQFIIPQAIQKFENSSEPFGACNAGIIGGNDVRFIKYWVKETKIFLARNRTLLPKVDRGALNIYFEQYLFFCLAREQNIPVHYLLKNVDAKFSGLADFTQVPHKKQYLHMVGMYKRSVQIEKDLLHHFHEQYPGYYYKIEKLLVRQIL